VLIGSGNRWKHKGTQGFYTSLGLLEDNNSISCIVVYYDLFIFIPPYPLLLYAKGVGL
jgi:hypothetical protein